MPIRVVVFDLDDTLIVDEAASKQAMEAVATLSAKLHGTDTARFLSDARSLAAKLWRENPAREYCGRIGISFEEALYGDLSWMDAPVDFVAFRNWAFATRLVLFDTILRNQELPDEGGAEELAAAFVAERRKAQRLMPDTLEVLARLKTTCKLAILTNGASSIQRDKITTCGLAPLFDEIVVSGEFGEGKPSAAVFHAVLAPFGCAPSEAVMVGNSLARDIVGAKAAGVHSVWLRVPGSEEEADVTPDFTIHGLHELPAVIAKLDS